MSEITITPSVTEVELVIDPVEIEVSVNPPVALEIDAPLVGVEVVAPLVEVEVSPVGLQGPPGPPGAGGGTPIQDVFVQETQPVQGTTPWYWFETDAQGNLTGNEWVYRP